MKFDSIEHWRLIEQLNYARNDAVNEIKAYINMPLPSVKLHEHTSIFSIEEGISQGDTGMRLKETPMVKLRN